MLTSRCSVSLETLRRLVLYPTELHESVLRTFRILSLTIEPFQAHPKQIKYEEWNCVGDMC